MHISLKPYKKDLDYSYASGVFATLELLHHKPEGVLRVFINSKGGENKGISQIKQICREHHIQVEVADGLVVKLSHSENCYAVGVFKKFKNPLVQHENHVVLVNPSDMGNMGTIIRTMIGFGLDNLAIIKPAADIFDPKVIRSSTGSFFQMHFAHFNTIDEYTRSFVKNNLYPFMLDAAAPITSVTFEQPFSLVFGNEGAGLPKEYSGLGTSVFIPHSKHIDSLNLSMAVGIAIFQACRVTSSNLFPMV